MEDMKLNVDAMRRYVAAASGDRADTVHDRIINIFWNLRRELPQMSWHQIDGLRAFVGELSDYNPFIPPAISQMEFMSRLQPKSQLSFHESWENSEGPVETLNLKLSDFAQSVRSDDQTTARQIRNHGNNPDYFYAKFAEWHVSLMFIRDLGSKTIVDLGTTHDGFAKITHGRLGDHLSIDMVDINYPKGRKEHSKNLFRVGANAKSLAIYEDESVDLFCFHNSLEHFSGESDSHAIAEVERILRPGGTALITPLLTAPDYILSLQPITCFLVPSHEGLSEEIEREVRREKCMVRYNHNIISPFARNYDYDAVKKRILKAAPSLTPTLINVRFDKEEFEDTGTYTIEKHLPLLREGALARRGLTTLKLEKSS